MAGLVHGRFALIRNNPSCKTPEADYPRALLPALEALTSCLASEEDYPRAFLHTLGVLASSQTSEEDYPRAFLQTSEVSPPPILSKKSTQGLFFKPRKSHILPYFRRRLAKGFPSNLGSLTSSHTSEEDYPREFLPALEALTSCLAFEEDYPRE